ncbi:MAG TPA: FlgD immunoglobulin-like domain containing protein [Myxococcota bacterium]|jgi:flagellar basal-body rod modification protein FlgD
MSTDSISSASTLGSGADLQSTPSTGSSKLGENEFVSLLMAQMQNQDPTAPQDSSAFVSQLAQFSNLQLQQGADDTLQSLVMAQTAGNQTGTANLVGKDVGFGTDDVKLTNGKTPDMAITLPSDASSVTVTVKDKDGNVVRTDTISGEMAGKNDFQFDGKDDDGNALPDGDYSFSVTAAAADGTPVNAALTQYGHVDGVSFADGIPELLVGGVTVKLAEVVEVDAASPSSPAATTVPTSSLETAVSGN